MTEIKISDLSIGDWVEVVDCDARQKKCCVVEGIEKWRPDYVVVLKYEDGGIETLGRECIEPIPLTPEILEKNGWLPPRKAIELDTWWWTNGVDKAIEAYEYEGEWYLTIIEQKEIQYRNRVGIGLKYVHQLQHALRLTGVEKEIEV